MILIGIAPCEQVMNDSRTCSSLVKQGLLYYYIVLHSMPHGATWIHMQYMVHRKDACLRSSTSIFSALLRLVIRS